jgi:hypothetical protein
MGATGDGMMLTAVWLFASQSVAALPFILKIGHFLHMVVPGGSARFYSVCPRWFLKDGGRACTARYLAEIFLAEHVEEKAAHFWPHGSGDSSCGLLGDASNAGSCPSSSEQRPVLEPTRGTVVAAAQSGGYE